MILPHPSNRGRDRLPVLPTILPVTSTFPTRAQHVSVLVADAGHAPYDAGVRHVATLAGYLSYGLMALAVVFGILTTTGWARRSVKRASMASGHMVLAVMALCFGLLHGIAYAFQTGEQFTYLMVFVPFAQGGEMAVALGIIGLELGLAAAISIWVQRRLGYRRWHLIHYSTYAAFALALALAHTIATSPEVRSLGGVGIIVAAAACACVLMFVLRLLPATTAVATRIVAQEA